MSRAIDDAISGYSYIEMAMTNSVKTVMKWPGKSGPILCLTLRLHVILLHVSDHEDRNAAKRYRVQISSRKRIQEELIPGTFIGEGVEG